MHGIIDSQRRRIFKLAGERGIDNEQLHSYIYALTQKESIKQLSVIEANKVIDSLGGKSSVPGMMTDKQRKFIEGLAIEIGWVNEKGKLDESRLQGFIKERFKIDSMKWVTGFKASQIIEALKSMKDREQKKEKVI